MLQGKTAVVTGSTSGIGLGIAEALARQGCHVALNSFTDSDEDRALPLLERLGVTATFYVNTLPFRDVATPSQIWRFLSQVEHAGEQITLSRPELRAIHAAGHTAGRRAAYIPL